MSQIQSDEKINDAWIYFSSIVNTVREALIILDEELKVLSANDAFYRLFRVSKEETEGKYIYELGSKQWDIDGLKEILERIIPHNDQFQDYVVEHVFPLIGHKIMLLNGRKINQGAGRPQLVLIAIEDITVRMQEKRSLEKYASMLEDANGQLRTFDYTVSHDLREPLNIIAGYTSILLEEHSRRLDDEGKRILQVLNNKVKEMDSLVKSLLRFSRISLEEMRLMPVDMNKIAESAISEVRTSSPGRKLKITIRQLPSAKGDAALLRQVWLNLIDNAVKFTRLRETAVIEIGGWSDEKEYVYCIKDNGIGFDMVYSNKLFGIFQRLQKEFEGTGTGLAIVRRIIQRHGGRVWAESKLDEGATFYFTLPKE